MSSVVISLATDNDDAEISRFFGQVSMPGNVQVSFDRSAGFLKAACYGNREIQVILGRDKSSQDIVGVGFRAIRSVYISGERTDIGYLGNLRLSEGLRGNIFLAQGYQFLRQLHEDGKVSAYLSTIMLDNRAAMSVLTSGRGGLPTYSDKGILHTCVISTKARRVVSDRSLRISAALPVDRERVFGFMERVGRRRNFFPADHSLLDLKQVTLAWQGEELIGCSELYDAREIKPIILQGYSFSMACICPLWNFFLFPWGWPAWPREGSALPYAFVNRLCVENNDPRALSALVEALQERAREAGIEYLLLGWHEDDPLWPFFKAHYRNIMLKSRLFLVHWKEGESFVRSLDRSRPPYVELSTL